MVCLVLGRNVGRDEDSSEREQFLQEKLHVPRPWIAEAKAVYASTVGNYGDQAWYLIQVNMIYDNKPLCKNVIISLFVHSLTVYFSSFTFRLDFGMQLMM